MQYFTFAAARDGDLILRAIPALSRADAERDALSIAVNHFGLTCPLDEVESELDGFQLSESQTLSGGAMLDGPR